MLALNLVPSSTEISARLLARIELALKSFRGFKLGGCRTDVAVDVER